MSEISINIDWAELDLYGHVNNVAFYKYMQSGRIAFCDSIGLSVLNEPDKPSFILAASECHYKQKLLYPGIVRVQSSVAEIHNTSFHLEHIIYNQNGEIAAKGRDVLVIYDYTAGGKSPIPEIIREKLSRHIR